MKKLMLMTPMLHQGGFERVCVATARLMQEYYDVTILIFSDKDINYDITGLNVINIDVPSKKGKISKAINLVKRIIKTRKIKKELGIDISYSFGSSANYVNVLSRRQEKVLTGLRCSTDMEAPDQVRLFCNKADQVLSCSKEIMRQLKRDYNYERSSYIYNPLDVDTINKQADEPTSDMPFGLDQNRLKTGAPQTDDLKLIVSVGRQDYIKGMWHLIKAFSIVEKENKNARLMIIGTGDWSGYEKLAKDLGVSDKVAFMGLKKNTFPYVAASDLYVLASNHEGFPNALLEAMALGKPCIAADCKTGPREILLSEEGYNDLITRIPDGSSTESVIEGDYGIIVPDMSEQVDLDASNIIEGEKILAGEILKMLADNEKLSEYGNRALERAKGYKPVRYREELAKILRNFH